jgi:hypothetical protein
VLFRKVLVRGVEARLMERREAPGRGLRRSQIFGQPFA